MKYTYKTHQERGIEMTKTNGNIFGYMRISTAEERAKQKYNRQEKALEKFANDNGIEYLMIFKEDKSGKNFTDREQWNQLERLLHEGDTVVFKDISRFTRDRENGYNKYMELMEKGINLIFIDNLSVSTSYLKDLLNVAENENIIIKLTLENTVKLLLIVELDRVEQERKILIKRTKDGIKASDKKQGRKTGNVDKLSDELEQDIKKYLQNREMTQKEISERHGVTPKTLRKYINIVRSKLNENEK